MDNDSLLFLPRTISTISVYSQTNFRFLMQPLWFSSLIFCTASLMLMLVALFTPYWVTESTPHGLLHGGLWSICLDPNCDFYPVNLGKTSCFEYCANITQYYASSPLRVLSRSHFCPTHINTFMLHLFYVCIVLYICRGTKPYRECFHTLAGMVATKILLFQGA